MDECKLCRSRLANQTGSHIFTYSLIKSAINEVGETARGKELTFGISTGDFFSLYFGQKMQPEDIEEVLGREIADEDIEENKNPFTKDNIFCTHCEKRFTIAEDFFFNKVQIPLNVEDYNAQESKKYGSFIKFDFESSLLIRLYFYIQLWRASVALYQDFILDTPTEEKLRKIIDSCLTNNLSTTLSNCIEKKERLTQFPLIITHAETIHDKNNKIKLTENVVYVDPSNKPYFLILNDFFAQFYSQKKHLHGSKKFFFGLTDALSEKVAINIDEEFIVFNLLSDLNRLNIIKTLYQKLANIISRKFIIDFTQSYIIEYGVPPSDKIILSALNVFISKYKASVD